MREREVLSKGLYVLAWVLLKCSACFGMFFCMYACVNDVCVCVSLCACTHMCSYGADAGVAIDDRAVTTVTLSRIRWCLRNTNQISLGT